MADNYEIHKDFIPKNEFDLEFYINHNDDVKKARLTTLDTAYKHWITYGCYENREVKSLKSGKIIKIKLKPNEKFVIKPSPQAEYLPTMGSGSVSGLPGAPNVITLGYRIAILIHIYDTKMFPFFTNYLNNLNNLYNKDNFDIYINVVEEGSPHKDGDLREAVINYMKKINNPNAYYFLSENRGGDIGGFMLLCKHIVNLDIDYKYVIFVHSKTRFQWRKELCQSVFNIKFENLHTMHNMGIIGSKKWLHNFNPLIQLDEYRRFKYHLVDLVDIYELGEEVEKPWQFIAGTMFLADMQIIKYIVTHKFDEVYYKLNRLDSIDINWLTIVTDELKKEPRGAGNDLQYRVKYGKPLHPDYMIEHTFERIIGLICSHLKLNVVGVM